MSDERDPQANPLRAWFDRNPGRYLLKWEHYFDIYHRHFARFRGRPVTVLEFGVFHGGSLQMWREYFGPASRIVGVDINPRLSDIGEDGVEIVIGDQGDRAFLKDLARRVGPIDVLIDDGGHTMAQQIATLEELYGAVQPDGVLLVEDTHTSYWSEYGGGLRARGSFMELAKHLADELNGWHSRDPHSFGPGPFTRSARSVHFYDSIVVIEKGSHQKPREVHSGTPSFPLDRPVSE